MLKKDEKVYKNQAKRSKNTSNKQLKQFAAVFDYDGVRGARAARGEGGECFVRGRFGADSSCRARSTKGFLFGESFPPFRTLGGPFVTGSTKFRQVSSSFGRHRLRIEGKDVDIEPTRDVVSSWTAR